MYLGGFLTFWLPALSWLCLKKHWSEVPGWGGQDQDGSQTGHHWDPGNLCACACVLGRWSYCIIRSRPGSRTDELNGGKYIKIGLDMRYDVGDAEERRVLMCVTVDKKNYIFIQGGDSLRACYILAGGRRLRKGKGRWARAGAGAGNQVPWRVFERKNSTLRWSLALGGVHQSFFWFQWWQSRVAGYGLRRWNYIDSINIDCRQRSHSLFAKWE